MVLTLHAMIRVVLLVAVYTDCCSLCTGGGLTAKGGGSPELLQIET